MEKTNEEGNYFNGIFTIGLSSILYAAKLLKDKANSRQGTVAVKGTSTNYVTL
jgi:hypothetical protein